MVYLRVDAQEVTKVLKNESDGFSWYVLYGDNISGAQDINGNDIIPLSKHYRMVSYSGGVFMVWDNSENVGHVGIYSKNGVELIPIDKYDEVWPYNINGIKYHRVKKNGLTGLCDNKGKEIIPVKYNSILEQKGFFMVWSEDEKYRGIYTKEGRELIPISRKYDIVSYEKDGWFLVKKEDKYYGVCDLNGKELIPPKYTTYITYDKSRGFDVGNTYIKKSLPARSTYTSQPSSSSVASSQSRVNNSTPSKSSNVSQSKTKKVKTYVELSVAELRTLAEQGDAKAQYELGNRYFIGEGVSENPSEAVKWFRKAAEQGLAEGQNGLGLCYGMGTGVSENKSEAAKWYRKAAEQGNASAQFNLAMSLLSENPSEAVKWFRKAAEQGDADSQFELGKCYYWGIGVDENFDESEKWMRKAANQGHIDAKDYLQD